MKALLAIMAVLVVSAPAARAHDAQKKSAAQKSEATFIKADEVKWGEAPPDLPKGAQIAVLHGDPSKSAPFALRLKAPDGYRIPPHWHTQAEELTVLSGTLLLHMGKTMDADVHPLDAGSFHYLPAKMPHAAVAKGDTVLQVNGKGPFDIHYLDPADNPKNAKAAAGGEQGTRSAGR